VISFLFVEVTTAKGDATMLKCAKVVALAVFAAGGISNAASAAALDGNVNPNLALSPELESAAPLAYLGFASTSPIRPIQPIGEDHDHDNGNDHDHEHTAAFRTTNAAEGSFNA
jgi:hypothetical protein